MTGTSAHVIVYKSGVVYAEGDTDPDGVFSTHLPSGDYEIHIQKTGFADIVKNVTISETEELMVNFSNPGPTSWSVYDNITEKAFFVAVPPQSWMPGVYSGILEVIGAAGNPTLSESPLCTKDPLVSETISEVGSAHK